MKTKAQILNDYLAFKSLLVAVLFFGVVMIVSSLATRDHHRHKNRLLVLRCQTDASGKTIRMLTRVVVVPSLTVTNAIITNSLKLQFDAEPFTFEAAREARKKHEEEQKLKELAEKFTIL